MAGGVELATGYVSLTVTAKGIQKEIAGQFSGVEKVAGEAGKGAGDKFGKEFADGTTSGNKVEGASKELGTKFAKGLVVAGAAIAAFTIHATKSFTESADAVKKFQRVAGGSFEDSSRLVFLFKRLGIEPEAATRSIGLLSRKLSDGSVDLDKYGVTLKRNADGSVNMKKAIVDIADAFSKLNANDRAKAIFDVFGRGGQTLLPILTKNRTELQAFFDLAAKDHQVFGKKDIDQADEYKKSLAELQLAWGGLEGELGKAAIPVLKGVSNALTPLVGLLADNTGALTTFGEIAGGPALAAIGAIFVTQKLIDFGPAIQKITAFARGLKEAGDAAEGLQGSLKGIGLGLVIVGTILALGKAIGYFDDNLTRTQKNAPKWAQAVVASSIQATGGVSQARTKFAELGKTLDDLQAQRSKLTGDRSKPLFSEDGKFIGRVGEQADAVSTKIANLTTQRQKLSQVIDIATQSEGKSVKVSESSKTIAASLADTLGSAAAKSNTYADAQTRLASAIEVSTGKDGQKAAAQKELRTALDGVATAQERVNNAVLASLNSDLAFQQGAKSLADQIAHLNDGTDASVDSLTFQQSAMAQAALAAKSFGDASELSGKGPLSASDAINVQRQALIDIQNQYPKTRGEIQPLIDKLNSLQFAAYLVAHTPADVHGKADLGDSLPKLQELQGKLNALNGATFTAFLVVKSIGSLFSGAKNVDGSPDRDGNPWTKAATGALVKASAGGSFLNVGEGGKDEAILPLPDLKKLVELAGTPAAAPGSFELHVHGVSVFDQAAADRIYKMWESSASRNGTAVASQSKSRAFA